MDRGSGYVEKQWLQSRGDARRKVNNRMTRSKLDEGDWKQGCEEGSMFMIPPHAQVSEFENSTAVLPKLCNETGSTVVSNFSFS